MKTADCETKNLNSAPKFLKYFIANVPFKEIEVGTIFICSDVDAYQIYDVWLTPGVVYTQIIVYRFSEKYYHILNGKCGLVAVLEFDNDSVEIYGKELNIRKEMFFTPMLVNIKQKEINENLTKKFRGVKVVWKRKIII